jgi:hypothetical protein
MPSTSARTFLLAAITLALALGPLPGLRAAPVAAPVVPPWCGGDPAACLLPFPNDAFTVADPTTDTGRRVNLPLAGMPRNVAGVPIDPTEWNRNDGFSPGSMVLTHVPGLDLQATWNSSVDHITDLKRYKDKAAPMVLLDADTGKRHPFWSELDTNATSDDDRLLILRPAVNLEEGHRYVVALRRLRRSDGTVIPAPATFAAYRDAQPLISAGFSSVHSCHPLPCMVPTLPSVRVLALSQRIATPLRTKSGCASCSNLPYAASCNQ